MKKTAEVIIIGGGAVGNAAAYYLAKRGVDVLVLEGDDSIGHGGSSRNGGGVRQSGRDVRELPYAIYGIQHIWPTLSEELGVDVEYVQKGNLRVGLTEEHIKTLDTLASNARDLGLDVTMIDGKEVQEICPYLSEEIIGASWCPTDGHANPMKTTLGFYKRARELGASFLSGAKVTEIRKYKGKARKVILEDGTVLEAGHIIVAAGYDSRPILNTVGIDVPMIPYYGTCIVTEMMPKMFDIMLGVANAEIYGHQCAHGSFVFGSGTGLEPTKVADTENLKMMSLDASANCRGIMKWVPKLKNAKVVRGWGGWMDITHDHVPVISEIDEVPGLIAACGFSGHGFGTAPAVGYMLSQMVHGEETVCDIQPLRYDRFKSNL